MKKDLIYQRNLEIIDLIKQGFNDTELSKRYNLCPESVRNLRLKNNLPNNFKSAAERKINWLDSEIKSIIDLNEKGYARVEISKMLNISDSRIENLLYKLNIKSKNIRRQNKTVNLSQNDIDILVGLILGDCYLGSISKNTSYCKIVHSIKQKEYVEHIKNELPNLFRTIKHFKRTFKHFNINDEREYLNIESLSFTNLKFFHELFYKENVKIIPDNIEDLLTPIGIAHWYMDDGYAIPYGYCFCTDCFSKEEQLRLIKCFKNKFDINIKLKRKNDSFRLGITDKESRNKFLLLVEPYIIESMKYKLRLIKQSKKSQCPL